MELIMPATPANRRKLQRPLDLDRMDVTAFILLSVHYGRLSVSDGSGFNALNLVDRSASVDLQEGTAALGRIGFA